MSYTQLYLQHNKKIPTLFAAIFILFVFIFFFKIFSNSSIPSKASKVKLKRIEITNLMPNQASVFWQTDQKETGWLLYGKKTGSLNIPAYDDRDIASNKMSYNYHHVTLKNLTPQTAYSFKLIAQNELLSKESLFTFTTPKEYLIKANIEPAYGKIMKSNNSPLENAIVMIELKNSYLLTGVTKSTGEWLIPMYAVYQKDTLQQKPLFPTDSVIINVMSESGQTSQISGLLNGVSPVPQTIIIGSNYSYGNNESVLGVTDSNIQQGSKELEIIYPKEGALIPGFSPIIKGKAQPNFNVTITIQGNNRTYATRTRSDNSGYWEIKMKDKMLIGRYLLTAEVKKQNGDILSDQRSFTIVANEGNDAKVLGVSSSSPTIVPLTPTPTIIILPTAPVATTSGNPTPFVSGSNQIIPTVGGISLVILGLGILLAF